MKYRFAIRIVSVVSLALIVTALLGATPVSQAQSLQYLSFNGTDGSGPVAGLVRDAKGNLYGTTEEGGLHGAGTVFKVSNSGRTLLWSFHSFPIDGAIPGFGALVLDPKGNLYGTTQSGGEFNSGTIFMVPPAGRETMLYSFTGGNDGGDPRAGLLILGTSVYGTTDGGGLDGDGVLFQLGASTGFRVLHTFTGEPDGANPWAGVVADSKGNLFGTTSSGGTSNYGTVYEYSTSTGAYSVLYNFEGPFGNSPDGAYPRGGAILDNQGNLYGTTYQGGSVQDGTIFEINTTGNEVFLYSLGQGESATCINPNAGLVRDVGGNFYGTTIGITGCIFEFLPPGTFTQLYGFMGPTGENPTDPLILDSAGNLYGTASAGGADNEGTVFKFTR